MKGVKAPFKKFEVRDDRPGVKGFEFCGHAKPGLHDNKYLAGSPNKRRKLLACQANVPPSPPPSSSAPRRCHSRSTGAWWGKRSQSGTPIKLPRLTNEVYLILFLFDNETHHKPSIWTYCANDTEFCKNVIFPTRFPHTKAMHSNFHSNHAV